jgi:hypothetical protein
MPGARQRSTAIDLALAGYGWAAHMTGDPLTPAEAGVLRCAQDILDRARQDLPHGRGNVTVDHEASAGEAGLRTQWSRQQRGRWAPPLPEAPTREAWDCRYGQVAALASFGGAGHCGEHGKVALARALEVAEPDDQVLLVENQRDDHTWVEVDRLTADGPVGAVVDAWADGPAIRARDGSFSQWTGLADGPDITTFFPSDAPHVLAGRDGTRATLEATVDMAASLRELSAEAEARGWKPKPRFAPTPVIADRVASAARAAHAQLAQSGDPWRTLFSEAAAVAADRTLGTPLREAAKRAPAVIAAGLQLDQPQPARTPPGPAQPIESGGR